MKEDKDLADAGFYGRIELPDHLTKKVLQVMEQGKIPCKDLADKVYEPMGLSIPGSARTFIGMIRSGHSDRVIPYPFKNRAETGTGKRQLYKISVLLHALELEDDDPLIQRFKNIYRSFEYPPRQQE